jgi:hypothetical protein
MQPDRYRTTINGDVVHIVDAQFYGAPRDFSQAAIKLLPDAITTQRQYRLSRRRTMPCWVDDQRKSATRA